MIVPKVGKYLGTSFGTGKRVTQGYPSSPMIFNIVVDAVVRVVLGEVCSLQEAQHGMGWEAGARNFVFYVDDRRVAGRDNEWVQDALTVTVSLFRQMGLAKNLEKTKTMVYNPGFIWGKWGELAYKRRATGEGATFRDRKKTRVSCATFGVSVAASYLKANMTRSHGICVPQMREVDEVGGGTTT